MAIRDFTVTITAVAQQLNVAALTGDTSRGGTKDEAYRELIITTETDCFLGGSSSLSTTVYGIKVFAQTASTPPVVFGPFEAGPVKLSDIWFIGTSGKMHVIGIPF